jgi:hypothetical protein
MQGYEYPAEILSITVSDLPSRAIVYLAVFPLFTP